MLPAAVHRQQVLLFPADCLLKRYIQRARSSTRYCRCGVIHVSHCNNIPPWLDQWCKWYAQWLWCVTPLPTAASFCSVPQTLQVPAQMAYGITPYFGVLPMPAGQSLVSIMPSIFHSMYMEYFHQCCYKLFCEPICSEFLDGSLVDSSSIINEL
jgi:hypothetical protein